MGNRDRKVTNATSRRDGQTADPLNKKENERGGNQATISLEVPGQIGLFFK